MRLLNQCNNPKFDRTCVEPYASEAEKSSFKKFKLNNFLAFRSMWEISRYDGDINNPKFDQDIKKLINDEMFYNLEGDYSNDIGKKLKNFLSAWQEIKKYPNLKSRISSMLGSFHSAWTNGDYNGSINFAADNDNFPVYFNVEKYFDFLMDRNGRLNFGSNINELVERQKVYGDLVEDWRAELSSQWEKHKEGDQES